MKTSIRIALVVALGALAFTACSERVGPSTAEKVAAAPDKIPFDAGRCWDQAIPGELTWQNGCKGSPKKDEICTMAIEGLTESEKTEYQAWVDAGKPATPCQKTD